MHTTRSLLVAITMLLLAVIGSSGAASAAGTADTVVSVTGLALSLPRAVATDSSGYLYIADTAHHSVIIIDNLGNTTTIGDGATAGFFGDGSAAGATTLLSSPQGLATDSSGNLYIADTGNNRIRMIAAVSGKITPASKISTVVGDGVAGFSGDSQLATAASLNSPTGVAVDSSGNLFIADGGNNRIRKVDASTKKISTIAGDGKSSTLTVYGIAISPGGDLFIADPSRNMVLKMTSATGSPAVFAGTGIAGNTGDGGLAKYATINKPSGVAIGGDNLYIADTGNSSIRKVPLATGVISTRAGSSATAAIAHVFNSPTGVAIDPTGNVYVADVLSSAVKEIYTSMAAETTADIPGGAFTTPQYVKLSAGSTLVKGIYYTLDGSNPLTSLTKITYSGSIQIPPTSPFTVPSSTTLKFASVDLASNQETVSTVTYNFVAAPVTTSTADLAAVSGIYYSARSQIFVSLASVSSASSYTIYYTADGKSPTTASPKYSTPIAITVPSTTTLKYFAVDSNGLVEIVKTYAVYTTVPLLTTPSVAGALFNSNQSVKLSVNDPTPASIYYTTNGVDPTAIPANLYTPGTAIAITSDTVLKYFATDTSSNHETIKTQNYYIDKVAPVITASPLPSGSIINLAQTITLTSSSTDDLIYFSLDGKTPATKYTTPILISATTTLSFFSKDKAGNQSSTTSLTYLIDSSAPVTSASLAEGIFASVQSVVLSTSDVTASIYYTTDGTTPTRSSQKYQAPIFINRTTTLKFFSGDSAGNNEVVQTKVYTIITITTAAYPPGGAYAANQTVTLITNAPNATIYYTTDGTIPTATGKTTKKYTAPLVLTDASNPTSTTTILQFFAVDTKGVIEKVRSEVYEVDNIIPTTTAKCITIDTKTSLPVNQIKLTATDSADPLPAIQYIANSPTNNGSAVPAYTVADYTSVITFTGNTIIKFMATDSAGNTETIKTAYCADVISVSASPAIYLETLSDTSSTPGTKLYVRGNVAPFSTTALTVNGIATTTSSKDGSFATSILLAAGSNTLTVTATDGANPPITVARTITEAPSATSATITIGSNNGVVGNSVRVPITVASGYQAAAVTVDIGYNGANLTLPRVELSPIAKSLGKTVVTSAPTANPFRIVISDVIGNAIVPVPDGIVAYVTFKLSGGVGTPEAILNSTDATNRAADIGAVAMSNVAVVDGAATIVKYPGDINADGALTLDEVLKALYMLADPVNNPVNGAVDLNSDGVVQIFELQQVINSFLGL